MKCLKCGLENRSNARFCKQCGQSLQVQQSAPPAHPPPLPPICPACGATAEPGIHSCPRCGKPFSSELADTMLTPPPYTAPPSPVSPPQPPIYAQPPLQPPPPPTAPPARRPFPRWVGWALAIAVFVCIAALVVAAIVFGSQLLDGKDPTATPSPEAASALDAQVAIAVSAVELQIGDPLTVTVANTGQTGTARIRANVIVDTREDPPATKPVSSESVVSVSIVQ